MALTFNNLRVGVKEDGEHPAVLQWDPADADGSGNWFDNDGYWYDTGRSGDLIPSDNWRTHQWPRLDPQIEVHPWPGLSLNFSWYRLRVAVDRETTLTSITSGPEGGPRAYWYPPSGYESAPITGWGTNALPLTPGTRRYEVRVTFQQDDGSQGRLRSMAPTQGPWAPKATDQDNAVWTRTWSQNCDEPPDTVDPEEWAVRISVRDPNVTSPDSHKQEYLQWLTSYLDVPYGYGEEWYGGWATNEKQNPAPEVNEICGIDCSGLVCCGARWAGYNWSPWRTNTSGLATDYYSGRINDPNNNLEPGDILNKPDGHVVTVYHYTPGHLDVGDSHIIEAAGGDIDKTWIRENVNIRKHYLRRGYTARELVWHGQ